MKLFLLSGSEDGHVVLDARFGEAPDPDVGIPVDLTLFADTAHERIRERYPHFTYEFAKTTGLLDIPGWRGIVTAYWLAPFSERSPMRTSLIEHLYHLILLNLAIQKHQPRELRVATDDDKLWCVIMRIATANGVTVWRIGPVQNVTAGRAPAVRRWWLPRLTRVASQVWRRSMGVWRIIRARGRLLAEAWTKQRLLRSQVSGVMANRQSERDRLVTFYTRYPVLWEVAVGRPTRERNFGTFPDYLAGRKFDVVYLGAFSSDAAELRATLGGLWAEARELGVVFLEGLVSVGELLRVYLAIGHVLRYLLWRARLGGRPISFDDINVRELVLRELNAEFLYGTELLTNYMRAYAFRRFCRRYRPRAIFHPFEYQPMERALYVGAKAGASGTTVIGLQTGMFSSNRLAWFYAEDEVAMPGVIPTRYRSPFPDYLAVYGTLIHGTLSRQCSRDRVLLVGPIRYPEMRTQEVGRCSPPRRRDLTSDARILVAGTINKDETTRLLRASAKVAQARPETFLLIKFHYHNLMESDWIRLVEASGCTRFQVCDTGLAALMQESRAVLLGWSSTGVVVEAIAAGCMPVMLQPPERYSYGTSVDIRDAIFACDDEHDLAEAVNQCVDQTPVYWQRRRAWPEALEKMAFPLDGRQDERLLAQLRERLVL